MKSTWINTKSLTIIPAILLALAGCSDSKKTDQASETALDEYRGFKFGTPIWELLTAKQCDISSEAREFAIRRIDYENTVADERITELRGKKLSDMSSGELQELMVLTKSMSIADSVTQKINETTDSDFLKVCYQKSDKLFGVNAGELITALGSSMRDICNVSFSRDMMTCEIKSEHDSERKDFLVFDSDSKGRLATIRFSMGVSVPEYKDAKQFLGTLQSKSRVKIDMLTHADTPRMGDLVQ